MGAPGLLSVADKNAPVFSLDSDVAKSLDIAYDIQGLLHRGKSKCDVEQIATLQQAGEQVPMYLWSPLFDYVLKNASHIASCVRSATFVIDGAPLPSKKDEIVLRKQTKAKLFADAIKLEETDSAGARKKFAASIEVSIDPVRNAIIEQLSSANLTIIQSPNEGDAQLAWLMKSNCIDVVFCNDSDLLLYGCERVVVVKSKNDPYTGSEYRINNVFNEADHLLHDFTPDKLIALALVCGCDFSDGITCIGWTKGASLIRDHWNENTPLDLDVLMNAAKAIGSNVVVPSNFIEQFTRGFITFKHQRVFNSSTNTIQYLSPPTDGNNPSLLTETLGSPIIDTTISQGIASGVLHPLELKPYDEVLPVEEVEVVESSESRARIIHKEMKEFEQKFNALSDDERKVFSDEYNQKLLLKEQEMQQKDPSDPEAILWKEREATFNKYKQEYQQNIKQHGTGNVDEERVIQWTMFVIKKVKAEHGEGVSGYGLKAMSGKDGTPLRNEEMMYIVDNGRNPTACKITHIVQVDDSSVAIGRHYKRSECRRYDDNDPIEDESDSNQPIHRYIQFPESIRGDCGGYYGELALTKVLFVVMGNVLNRTYFGRAIDPFGLKDHCFGLSFIVNFSELLDNNAMGICTAQASDVIRHFRQNITTSFMSVKVAGRARTMTQQEKQDAFTVKRKFAARQRNGEVLDINNEEIRKASKELGIPPLHLINNIGSFVNGNKKANKANRDKQQLDLLQAGSDGKDTVFKTTCNRCIKAGATAFVKFVNNSKPHVRCKFCKEANRAKFQHWDWTVDEPLSQEQCKRELAANYQSSTTQVVSSSVESSSSDDDRAPKRQKVTINDGNIFLSSQDGDGWVCDYWRCGTCCYKNDMTTVLCLFCTEDDETESFDV